MERIFVVPLEFSKLFWDVDFANLDSTKNRKFIIERVLNMGDQDSLRWLCHTYSEEEILDTVKTSKNFLRKQRGVGKTILD